MLYWYESLVLYIVSFLVNTNSLDPSCECVVFQSYGLSKGTFHSPDYPHFYRPGINCILYTFIGDINEIVEIEFLDMDLKTKYPHESICRDFIRVYKNLDRPEVTTGSRHDDELCGSINNMDEKTFYSSDRALILEFHTDSRSNENHTGFKGMFAFKDKTTFRTDGILQYGTECRWDIHSSNNHSSGRFFSPRYPQKYPRDSKCQYNFMGHESERVKVTFKMIQLPGHGSVCGNRGDVIRVYDGSSSSDIMLEKFCSTNNRKQIISSGPYLYIEFRSDSRIEKQGFSAEYTFVRENEGGPPRDGTSGRVIEPSTGFACNHTYNVKTLGAKTGVIKSPHYPDPYPAGLVCHYEFIAEGQQRIQINITNMDLFYSAGDPDDPYGCMDQDSIIVQVYIDGKEEELGRFCGKKLPPLLMSNGQRMKVIFKSEAKGGNGDHSGFRIQYAFRTDFGVQGNGVQDDREICTFMFRSTMNTKGYFTSPNYGGQYPRLTECHYLFFGRDTEKVEIHFQQFDVDGIIPRCDEMTDSDYVSFSNFLNVIDRKMPRYCGNRIRYEPQKSDASFFRVAFKSNDKYDADGFNASYSFVAAQAYEKTTPVSTESRDPNPNSQTSVNTGSRPHVNVFVSIATILIICQSVISRFQCLHHLVN